MSEQNKDTTSNSNSKNKKKSKKNSGVLIGCLIPLLVTFLIIAACIGLSSENYSNGERIGLITQFSHRGVIWKTWEGHLNITQTGMNSAAGFDFSVDKDDENQKTIKTLDSAATLGWKIKMVYRQTYMKNWLSNRGETNYFIDKVEVLDRNFSNHQSNTENVVKESKEGKAVDTIYVVITPDDPNYDKFFRK